MSHEQLLRLFIAVDLPEIVRSNLATLQNRLKPIYAGGTFGDPADFHVTLHFLGDTAVSRLPELIDALRTVEMPYIDLQPQTLTHFPDAVRARVAAVQLGGDVAILTDLQSQLGVLVKDLGYRLDHRAFKPHVTIARFKFPPHAEKIDRAVAAADSFLQRAATGRVGQFTLFQSTLDKDAPRYAVLGRFPRV